MRLFHLTLAITFLTAACSQPDDSKAENEPTKTEIIADTSAPTPAIYAETAIKSGELGGTYLNAGDSTPIIVIVPGSGPTNKDGNNMGMKSNAYKFLAHDLADAGISSIRVDKRGMFSSREAGDPNAVTVDIYTKDYRNWAQTAIEKTGNDCAYLLGHSEGGLMVTAAAIDQDNICGLILVSAPGFKMSDVLRRQLKDNPANAPILDEALSAINTLEAGETVNTDGMHPALMGLFSPTIQPYWISVFQVDPAELLAAVEAPKLVLQGSHDVQVSIEDAQRLSKMGRADLVTLDQVNHVLKRAPEDFTKNIMSYNSPDTPIDDGVVKAISSFLDRH